MDEEEGDDIMLSRICRAFSRVFVCMGSVGVLVGKKINESGPKFRSVSHDWLCISGI